jgi:hypothetical protein
MIAVFLSSVALPDPTAKMFGIGPRATPTTRKKLAALTNARSSAGATSPKRTNTPTRTAAPVTRDHRSSDRSRSPPASSLLARHRDPEPLLRRDHVVERIPIRPLLQGNRTDETITDRDGFARKPLPPTLRPKDVMTPILRRPSLTQRSRAASAHQTGGAGIASISGSVLDGP